MMKLLEQALVQEENSWLSHISCDPIVALSKSCLDD